MLDPEMAQERRWTQDPGERWTLETGEDHNVNLPLDPGYGALSFGLRPNSIVPFAMNSN